MNYVNIAAAIQTLAAALVWEKQVERKTGRSLSLAHAEGFTAGVSYAIGMMLDPDTAAIIEQAAKDRAQEDN